MVFFATRPMAPWRDATRVTENFKRMPRRHARRSVSPVWRCGRLPTAERP